MTGPPTDVTEPGASRRGRLFIKYVASLVGLVALVLIGNGALDVWFSYQEAKQALVRIQQEKAESAAQRIAAFVEEIERQIGWTTHAQWSMGSVDQRRFDYVRLLRQVPAITELVQLDNDGREQLRVSRLAMDVVGSGTDYSQEPKFTEAVAHKVWFSPVYFRKESEPYMTIAIAHVGRKPGVTVAEVNLKLIWDVVNDIKVGKEGYAYVVGPQGRLIAHPDISLVLRNTDLSRLPQVAAALADHGSDLDSATIASNYAGASVLTAHAAIPGLNWRVFVELPASEALAPLYELLVRSGILLGLALLLAATAALLLARRMTVPIRQLQAGAARFGAGELDRRIAIHTGDELEELADDFNRMASDLQKSYSELEKRVEERTAELKEALDQQTATAEVLQVINASPGNLAPVFDTILEKAHALCGAEFGVLLRYDGELFWPVATHGHRLANFESSRHGIRPGFGFVRLVRGERLLHVHDMAEVAASLPEDPVPRQLVEISGVRTQLAVPLRHDDKLLGVITANRREVLPFAEKEITLLENFAAQAVIAMENARLLEEQREALDQQTANAEVLRVINSSPGELTPVFDAMLDKAMRLCEAAFGIMQTYDGERFGTAAVRGVPDALVEWRRREPLLFGPGTAPARIVAGEDLVHEVDLMASDAYQRGNPERRAIVDLGGARSHLIVALRKDGTLLGTIAVYRQEVRPFNEKQIALLQNFAAQAVIAIENARLITETREALEQQTATAEVLRVINSSPGDLAPVFDAMLEKALRLCEATFGSLYTYEGEHIQPVAMRGVSPEFAELIAKSPPTLRPGSPQAKVIQTRRPVHVPDLMDDEMYPSGPTRARALVEVGGARSLVNVPLVKDDQVLGFFAIYRQNPGEFSDKQIALLENFAAQAVIAMENARLLSETREALEQQTATAEVLQVINSSPGDLGPVFDTMLDKALDLCGAAFGNLWTHDGEMFHAAAVRRVPIPYADALSRLSVLGTRPGTVLGQISAGSASVQILDAAAAEAYLGSDARAVVELGHARTVAGVALRKDGALLGAITIYRQDVRPFSDKQMALLQNFAAQAVIAMENARLIAETREALEQQTATAEVLRVINSSPGDLAPVFDAMLDKATGLCDAAFGILWRFDGSSAWPQALHQVPAEFAQFWHEPRQPSPESGPGRMMRGESAQAFPDIAELPVYAVGDPMTRAIVDLARARSSMIAPLRKDGATLGAITIYRQEVRPFSDKQIALLQNFAAQAVIAMENARLLAELRDRSAELARSVAELTTLQEVGQAVSSTLDLATVLETIVTRAVSLAGADAGAIYGYRQRDHQFQLGESFGFDEAFAAQIRGVQIREAETNALARAIQERTPAQIADLTTAPALPLGSLMAAAGYRSVLIVPLIAADQVFGVLAIQKKSAGEFPDGIVRLMQTFASQSVLAIQNARLFREVEEQGRALAVASQHKSQFLANMSHELRTPLNAVLGYAELLADGIYGELPEKAQGVLERILSNGKHLLGLINDVLDLSRIEAGQLTLTIEDYAMLAVVHSVVSATEALAKAKGLTLIASVPRVLPLGRGDERRLTQVLLNLVGNAIKFTDNGSVGIEVSLSNGCFDVAVSDTGPGIAKADQARIFEEFQQVDNSSTRQKGGSGLGLAISKRIIEMHGGDISVDSEPGRGATFRVVIPVQVAQVKEVA